MKTSKLEINGPILIQTDNYHDQRGFFREIWNTVKYIDKIPHHTWVQTNHSHSKHATVRGMHFQENEAKLISVISGKIFDVALDIRRGSETFGKHIARTLGPADQMYIPAGFAHGFCVLSEDAHVVYQTNQFWDKDGSGAIRWDDPDVDIEWPVIYPILSDKDKVAQSFKEYVENLDTRF